MSFELNHIPKAIKVHRMTRLSPVGPEFNDYQRGKKILSGDLYSHIGRLIRSQFLINENSPTRMR